MKKLFYPLAALLVLITSCKASKDYLSRSNDDRTLFDVVKAFNKHPGDSVAIKALPVLYPLALERHQKKIDTYNSSPEISRWDKIIDEYTTLQKMYEVISSNTTASRLVNPVNFQNKLSESKQQAAEAYYQQADRYLQNPGRADAKNAYVAFKKADKISPGYKDAKAKMNEAFQNAIVNVVIKPVEDNSFFFNTGWGNTGYNYSNEYFQQSLVRELGGKNATRFPARFYTDWDARRDNVTPDWVVELNLRYLDIPAPSKYVYNRAVSQYIEIGRDTLGNDIKENVYATLQITSLSFTAHGQMEVNITDMDTRKNISNNAYRGDYSWKEEYANYTGDSRALSNSDWLLINKNMGHDQPGKEQVLSELYRTIYSQVKNSVVYAVDW